jgi:hypothetical protein
MQEFGMTHTTAHDQFPSSPDQRRRPSLKHTPSKDGATSFSFSFSLVRKP